MTTDRRDITPLPNLETGSGRVGPIRSRMPIYVDLLPPCNEACPAGENIQEWLRLVKEGEEEAAWRQLTRDNPFPAILGRVCYHPCEYACNRIALDSAVSIHSVERYLGDKALDEGWQFTRPRYNTGFRVLIIGGGPAGLSAAYHLARLGHEVEIHDSADAPGGMMRYGIPEYRLPRDILDAELKRITDLGVVIKSNHWVKDLLQEQRDGHFDAVFVAVGAHLAKQVDIPEEDAARVIDAVDFLREVAEGDRPDLGERVVTYGGGNTAMDASRVARRLGVKDSVIVYRRTQEQMPAKEEELEEALSEGVQVHWLRTITAIKGHELMLEIMELDETGRPYGTGKYETLQADTVIMAVGQDAQTSFLHKIPGLRFKNDVVQVDPETLMTDVPGIFAGGDAVPAERTVTVGIGHGKRAARMIDAWLNRMDVKKRPKHPVVKFADLNLWYFGDHSRREQPELDPETRIEDFDEVVGGLTEQEAIFEAFRCLSCGNCFECDGCLGSCPEGAVIKLGKGHRYRFDYEKCTGCATCYEQCPVHAIEMIEEN